MTPGFSPRFSGPANSLHSASDTRSSFTSFAPSAPSRSDSAWSVPARSMSYGLVEDLHMSNQSPYHHPQQATMELRRRASLMNPPSLQTSNNSSNTSLNETHMTPLSAPVSTPPLQHWGVPSTWAALPSSSYVSKAPDYGSWYGEPPSPRSKKKTSDLITAASPQFCTQEQSNERMNSLDRKKYAQPRRSVSAIVKLLSLK